MGLERIEAIVQRLTAPPPVDGKVYGLLAEFATVPALFQACEQVRDAGYSRWDAHTPFPVHGIEQAMGLKRSPLPWLVIGSALVFAGGGFALQAWVHSIEYPLVISGKPFFTWPAYVPVTFELGVLGGALAAVFGMLALNRLSRHNHPLFSSERFEGASDDRFFISVEACDPHFDAAGTRTLLERAGATRVETVTS